MQFEEDAVTTNQSTGVFRYDVTRHTLGARGIDMIEAERIASSTPNDPLLNVPSRVYPLYDGHGNMVATLKKSGVNNFTLANEKRYEAWGKTRFDDGIAGSDHVVNPKTQYCANLGHSFDENSGLTYMRARWYDAGTGRFISEDRAFDGINWFAYCLNRPITSVDGTGHTAEQEATAWWLGGFAFSLAAVFLFAVTMPNPATITAQLAICTMALFCFQMALNGVTGSSLYENTYGNTGGWLLEWAAGAAYAKMMVVCAQAARAGLYTHASLAVLAVFTYSVVLLAALGAIDADSQR